MQKRLRQPVVTNRHENGLINRHGKQLISFGCNDYLGLSRHPNVLSAATEATEKWGTGAGASQLVSGYSSLIEDLEQALAHYCGTESACLFGSGYLANLGTISALVGKNDLIIADKLMHACMVDGSKLSGANLRRFKHNDVVHLEQLLKEHRQSYDHCLVLVERVYSMDGDVAPLDDILALAKHYDAWLLVDDAHGMGVLPPYHGDYLHMGTLSKALGSYGGYVAGSQTLIKYLKTSARSLMFSTALPPASVAAALAALKVIQDEPQLRETVLNNARLFTQLMGLKEAQSTIVPWVVKDESAALALSLLLEEQGYYVPAIRPPTVPVKTARLRFAFSVSHTPEMIRNLIDVLGIEIVS